MFRLYQLSNQKLGKGIQNLKMDVGQKIELGMNNLPSPWVFNSPVPHWCLCKPGISRVGCTGGCRVGMEISSSWISRGKSGQGIWVNKAPESKPRVSSGIALPRGRRQQEGMWEAAGAPFLLKISIIPVIVWLMEDISLSQEGTGGMHQPVLCV